MYCPGLNYADAYDAFGEDIEWLQEHFSEVTERFSFRGRGYET